ncbi:MAG: cell division protein ZipA [Pseudomonadota bacterium]
MDNSFALRLGLLLVGAVVVGLIYLFGTRRARNRRRFRTNARVETINSADMIGAQQSAQEKSEIFSVADAPVEPEVLPDESSLKLGDDSARISAESAPVEDLPLVEKNPNPRRRKNRSEARDTSQIEMHFDDASANSDGINEEEHPQLITLYVLPPGEHAFVGESIVQGLNSVGLHYGDMDIFHHHGAGRLQTKEPLFSVANMLEPGTFDMQQIDRFTTPGLVFFLQLPTSLDGAVSFELFLNTAQRLTETLDGTLYANPRTPLDSTLIEEMRKVAADF